MFVANPWTPTVTSSRMTTFGPGVISSTGHKTGVPFAVGVSQWKVVERATTSACPRKLTDELRVLMNTLSSLFDAIMFAFVLHGVAWKTTWCAWAGWKSFAFRCLLVVRTETNEIGISQAVHPSFFKQEIMTDVFKRKKCALPTSLNHVPLMCCDSGQWKERCKKLNCSGESASGRGTLNWPTKNVCE